jgi:hypothetical protein
MNLTEQIKRIHEIFGEYKNNRSDVLEKLLKTLFVDKYSHLVCKVEVEHPEDRQVLQGQPKYKTYSITITFIGGYGTRYWPRTMRVNDMYEELMNEAWDIVHSFTNIPCDLYSKYVQECN